MEVYEDLLKRLRDKAGRFNYDGWIDTAALLEEAADAIDELSKRTFSLAPIDPYDGLKRKYIVLKADTGETVQDCFVLRPAKDHAAVEALRTYARETDNKTLADDIYRWVGPLPDPPEGGDHDGT